MTWFDALPALAVGALLFIGIGTPFALAIGARGVVFLGVAVGSSVGLIAGASTVAGAIGLDWNLLPVAIAAVLAAGAGYVVRRWVAPRSATRTDRAPREWTTSLVAGLGGMLIGAVLIAIVLLPGIQAPDHLSQTYDGIFHLNAVQWVLDTADASPLHMTMTTPAASTNFYPTVWHAAAALIVQLTGASIVVATNATAVVVAAIVWPLACVFLARVLFGANPLALVLAGGLSAGFGAFPITLVKFGVLYPNLLAVAVLPIALGALAAATGVARRAGLRLPEWWTVLPVVGVGLALAHPNAVFSLILLSVPLWIQWAIVGVRRADTTARRVIVIVTAVAVLAVEALVWTRVGTSDNGWAPRQSIPTALLEGFINGPNTITVGIVSTLLVAVGIVGVFVIRRSLTWLVIAYVLTVVSFAVANGAPAGALRTMITGIWYNDANRLAAVTPVVAVPLAVLGTLVVLTAAGRGIRRLGGIAADQPIGRAGVVALIALVAVLIAGTQVGGIQSTKARLHEVYASTDDSAVLSPDERALIDEVPSLTDPEAVIAGNPWNGSSLVYALTGRSTLFPHVGGRYPVEYQAIAAGLGAGEPEACAAAHSLDVRYVLDFGDRFVFAGDLRAKEYPGLTALQDPPALSLVAERGSAKLYEVTGC